MITVDRDYPQNSLRIDCLPIAKTSFLNENHKIIDYLKVMVHNMALDLRISLSILNILFLKHTYFYIQTGKVSSVQMCLYQINVGSTVIYFVIFVSFYTASIRCMFVYKVFTFSSKSPTKRFILSGDMRILFPSILSNSLM